MLLWTILPGEEHLFPLHIGDRSPGWLDPTIRDTEVL